MYNVVCVILLPTIMQLRVCLVMKRLHSPMKMREAVVLLWTTIGHW